MFRIANGSISLLASISVSIRLTVLQAARICFGSVSIDT